jgi:ubiquinone/menaquinone biosynthesis C-methylase UbiE
MEAKAERLRASCIRWPCDDPFGRLRRSADETMSKWPKQLPPLTPEQQRISDDFMQHWHEIFASRYGFIDQFNHSYVVKHSPKAFRTTLEIGAGLGEHLAYERLTPEQEANYVAVDLRENMLANLRQRFPRVQARLADCQARLDFPDGYFDRIIAIHVLEHLPNLPATVSELSRLCKKGTGSLFIVIPCEGSMATRIARSFSARRVFERRYHQSYDWFINREHINRPGEIFEEISRHFNVRRRSFFPVPLPFLFCNLFVAATCFPDAQPPAPPT